MLASGGGEVRLYDPNADQLEAARRYVEAELPRVAAGRSGALPGRLVLSRTLPARRRATTSPLARLLHRAFGHPGPR
jgi:hypothetical protein